MRTAEDAYSERYHADDHDDAFSEAADARRLELVRPATLAFELVSPQGFEDAQTIADRLRAGAPVVIDLGGCEPGLSGRITDFCSGLVYALEGGLQCVGDGVLLLTPSRVDVSGGAASGVMSPGFFNRR